MSSHSAQQTVLDLCDQLSVPLFVEVRSSQLQEQVDLLKYNKVTLIQAQDEFNPICCCPISRPIEKNIEFFYSDCHLRYLPKFELLKIF